MAQTLSNTALSLLREAQVSVTTSGSARSTSGRSYAPRLVNALLREGYLRKTVLHYFTGGLRLTPLASQALHEAEQGKRVLLQKEIDAALAAKMEGGA